MKNILYVLIFFLLLLVLLNITGINLLKRDMQISFKNKILNKKRNKILNKANYAYRGEKFLIRFHSLLKSSGYSLNRYCFLTGGAFVGGFVLGIMLFANGLLSFLSGFALLPLPFLYLRLKAHHIMRQHEEELQNAMSVVTNAYISNNDIIMAVQEYAQEKNRYVKPHDRLGGPFEEFLSEVILVSPNLEAALFRLAAKLHNRYADQWVKMLVLCMNDQNMKFALLPIINSMQDEKSMQIENDTQMMKVWKDYLFTLALMFAVIPILRFANAQWFAILTQTIIGQLFISLMLIVAVLTSFYVAKINSPISEGG